MLNSKQHRLALDDRFYLDVIGGSMESVHAEFAEILAGNWHIQKVEPTVDRWRSERTTTENVEYQTYICM